jgi:DNA mismatch repair protein MutL
LTIIGKAGVFITAQGKIKILPAGLANKIAAGEVVERPASVVKELIENAIDADAQKITVVLQQSGKQLIQVIDDGSGMSAADLEMAFERHATSKIATDQDLEKIETLGFRGEALPSIASVSRISISSRVEEEQTGTVLELEAGKIAAKSRKAMPRGTQISIKNLFYNTPARRNFLRADSTELQQILTTLKRFMLAYPHIEYEVYNGDNLLFKVASGNIEERLIDLFGSELFHGLVLVHETLGGIELSGFISRPDLVRKTRGNQFLFLNGRPIQDKSLNHAIYQSYGNLIAAGDYPPYVFFLEMDPRLVDVNVHPTKMEVRFANDRSLYFFLLSSIRKVFTEEKIIPKIESGTAAAGTTTDQVEERIDIAQEFKNRRKYLSRDLEQQLSLVYFKPRENPAAAADLKTSATQDLALGVTRVDVPFWQIHNRYIISEIKSGIVIIDQHVAHERILFEKMLRVLHGNEQAMGQQLLFPQTLTLAVDDFLILEDFLPGLEKIGFSIRIFSGRSIVIDAIPLDVKIGREAQIMLDIVDYYKENQGKTMDPMEKLAAGFACKNAIKSGESLSPAEMHAMVDQLFACQEPYFCPHGRPVVITMDLDEFDRKFKRIV